MAEVRMTLEEYYNLFKGLNTLIEKLYEMAKEGNDYKRQRDELINDIEEVKRKAEAFDEIKEYTLDKIEMFTTRQEFAPNSNEFEYSGNLLTAFKAVKYKMIDFERETDGI